MPICCAPVEGGARCHSDLTQSSPANALCLFHRGENWGPERGGHLSKDTRPLNRDPGLHHGRAAPARNFPPPPWPHFRPSPTPPPRPAPVPFVSPATHAPGSGGTCVVAGGGRQPSSSPLPSSLARVPAHLVCASRVFLHPPANHFTFQSLSFSTCTMGLT